MCSSTAITRTKGPNYSDPMMSTMNQEANVLAFSGFHRRLNESLMDLLECFPGVLNISKPLNYLESCITIHAVVRYLGGVSHF